MRRPVAEQGTAEGPDRKPRHRLPCRSRDPPECARAVATQRGCLGPRRGRGPGGSLAQRMVWGTARMARRICTVCAPESKPVIGAVTVVSMSPEDEPDVSNSIRQINDCGDLPSYWTNQKPCLLLLRFRHLTRRREGYPCTDIWFTFIANEIDLLIRAGFQRTLGVVDAQALVCCASDATKPPHSGRLSWYLLAGCGAGSGLWRTASLFCPDAT